jgi:hypothetical protein
VQKYKKKPRRKNVLYFLAQKEKNKANNRQSSAISPKR